MRVSMVVQFLVFLPLGGVGWSDNLLYQAFLRVSMVVHILVSHSQVE